MKKIYLSLIAFALFNTSRAQLTLTQAANEPVVGNIHSYKLYDSVGVIPKATGAGLSWNFGAFTANAAAPTVKTYSLPGAIPQSSLFPGCTLVEVDAANDNTYIKSVASPSMQYESLGIGNPGAAIVITFTNSELVVVWPVAFGYNNSDIASGTAAFNPTLTGPANASINVTAPGSGTLIVPGGNVLTNILQIKISTTLNIALATQTLNIVGIDYSYFHGTQKFDLLTVSYETTTNTPSAGSPTISKTAFTKVNSALLTGLNEINFDATFQIFPNPAKDAFTVKLNNSGNDKGIIEIFNSLGQLTKSINLGNASLLEQSISLQGFASGVYTVKTTIGNRLSSRKLIIE